MRCEVELTGGGGRRRRWRDGGERRGGSGVGLRVDPRGDVAAPEPSIWRSDGQETLGSRVSGKGAGLGQIWDIFGGGCENT